MPRTAIVTGANQGLGLAITRGLAARMEPQDVVYLAARSQARGREALETLGPTRARVELAHLDVTDAGSIRALADMIETRHGGVDVVASNAAARITREQPQSAQVGAFIATNNHGSTALYEALEPRLRANARYVMVASSFGQLRHLPVTLHDRFDTGQKSLGDIELTMAHYAQVAESGVAADEGWPEWINIASKVGQVAAARIAARDMTRSRPSDGILINAVCPGLVDTEASRPWFDDMSKAQTPDAAAEPIVSLLLAPPGATAPHGELVRAGEVLPWP